MKVYVQTPTGWVWIDIPIPAPSKEKTDMQHLREDVAAIKAKLGII